MANEQPKELATKKKSTSSSSPSSKSKSSSSKSTKKVTKTTTKALTKVAKKNPLGALLIGASLVLGLVAGYVGFSVITANDTYEMNAYNYASAGTNIEGESAKDLYGDLGEETAILLLNENYVEAGCKCVVFGKDVSSDINVTYYYREDISHDIEKVEEVDTSRSGFYYACYENTSFKYKSVELIRNIIVVEVEQDG